MTLLDLLLALAALVLGAVLGWLATRGRAVAALAEARANQAALTARLETERAAAEQRTADLRAEHDRLTAEFKALSAEALTANTEQFLTLAGQRLGAAQEQATHESAHREQAVTRLVGPIQQSLAKVESQLQAVEVARAEAYGELRAQVAAMGRTSEQLRQETQVLVSALRKPQVRGQWGELQLRRTVEAAGMSAHCDFVEQASAQGGDGRVRPDLVVRLTGGKQVVVDSKVPLTGWLEAMEATDDAVRAARLAAHARHVRGHVQQLSAKTYWAAFDPTPEMVVMFVPSDAFLDAALREDAELLEHAFAHDVVVATPSTLVALLRTIAYTWRQDALADNAARVLALGRELHGRLATMGGHVTKLGNALTSAVKAYDATVASLESRVLVSARKMAELRVVDADLEGPAQLAVTTRLPVAPELVAPDGESALRRIG